jgi:hypothetical protein
VTTGDREETASTEFFPRLFGALHRVAGMSIGLHLSAIRIFHDKTRIVRYDFAPTILARSQSPVRNSCAPILPADHAHFA